MGLAVCRQGLTPQGNDDTISIMVKIIVDTGEVYDVLEAARLLGVGYATVYRWIKAGKIVPVKLAGRTLIPKTEVDRLKGEE